MTSDKNSDMAEELFNNGHYVCSRLLVATDGYGTLIEPGSNITSNKACRPWASMVRGLDIESIVPQYDRAFVGKAMVKRFIDWVETLKCGIDLINPDNYRTP